MPIKKIQISDNIRNIILNSSFTQDDNNLHLTLQSQLDRKQYVEVNKFLELIGGKWNKKLKTHIFENTNEQELRTIYSQEKLEIEKDGFFPTPTDVIDRMLQFIDINIDEADILEPSAGEGHIVDYLVNNLSIEQDNITVIERNKNRRKLLIHKGYRVLLSEDCLLYNGEHNLILMNPPFENGQDVDHVTHLFENCLLEGGQLIGVMSASVLFREDKKYKTFRDRFVKNDNVLKLESGSFKESGTMVNSIIISLRK